MLADMPREDGWWEKNKNLYLENFQRWGFETVPADRVQPGDVFIAPIWPSEVLSHGGMLIDHDLILHHLPERLSRREPAGIWARYAQFWVRYTGRKTDA